MDEASRYVCIGHCEIKLKTHTFMLIVLELLNTTTNIKMVAISLKIFIFLPTYIILFVKNNYINLNKITIKCSFYMGAN